MNLLELYESSKEYKAWRQDYSQNTSWVLKNVVPYKGTKTLLIQAQCHGQTVNGEHVVNIQFQGLKFVDEVPKNAEYKTIEHNGTTYYLEYPTVKTQCTVRCSCPDFTYRFAYADHKKKCLFGSKPKKYIKKTNRPPLNPKQIPGGCKHIWQAQSLLKVEKIMK